MGQTEPPTTFAPPRPGGFHIPRLRWVLAGMLFLISVLNYIDRQTLSILATTIQGELGLSEMDYARVTQAFLICYTGMYLVSGRIVDRVGPRWAEAGFILWWSVATALTGLATGLLTLIVYRGLLGLGEPGHYAASAKVVSQWFPPRERGVAVGMYVMGGTLGAALAAPLVVALTAWYGWRGAFVATGAVGVVFALVWFALYRPPGRHPWLGDRERELLQREGVLTGGKADAPAGWGEVLRSKPVWVLLAAKALTDSVWYFYLFWFAKYLQAERGFGLNDIAWTGVVFLAADAGCLLGGWLSGRLIRRGRDPVRARLTVMAGAAAVLALNVAVPRLPGGAWPVVAVALFACAAMVWMTNSVTLVIDLVPGRAVGSAQGLVGTGGALGGVLSQGLIGHAVTHYSYAPVYAGLSLLHPLALALLWFSLGRRPLPLPPAPPHDPESDW